MLPAFLPPPNVTILGHSLMSFFVRVVFVCDIKICAARCSVVSRVFFLSHIPWISNLEHYVLDGFLTLDF